MKLYIPTCTLNFNNIFSTESISPASHYASRGFGIKRYYKVEANNLDNVVLLYSKYPHYCVDSGDIENSAMVIEIESEDYCKNKFIKVNEKDGVEVYVSNTTIYLNPCHCLVYFFSYQDRQSALTKAEQSLENKYSKLYTSNLLIRKEKSGIFTDLFSNKDYFDWESSYVGIGGDVPLSDVREDVLIDRIKGCIVCYLIGANMSVSKDVSRLKQLARKMKNTLSAIVNSPNRKPTDYQDETLLSYIKEFNRIFSKVDENANYNNNIIEQRLVSPSTNLDKDTLKKVLQDLGLEEAFYHKLRLRPIYDANELYSCLDSSISITEAYSSVINRLFNEVKRIEVCELSKSQKKYIKELVSVANGEIAIIDDFAGSAKYYNTLLASQIREEYKQFMEENGTEELLSIAFVAGALLKGLMPEKWEGSQYQTFINGLLGNIQQGDSFDIFSIEQPVLQSLAAFCQKGEEIDRLTDYMQQCGFSDFRFAFGIYGATRGFASLPKTLTTSLINASKDYYMDFFLELHKSLFGMELPNAILYKGNSTSYSEGLSGPISSTILDNIDQIEPKRSKQEKIVDAVSQTAALEDAVQNPKAFMYILDSFPNMTRTNAYKKLKDTDFENDNSIYDPNSFRKKIYSIIGHQALKGQKERIDTAIELEAKRQDPEAFLYILDNFLNRDSNAYKKIAKLVSRQIPFVPKGNERADIISPRNNPESERPRYTIGKIFVSDYNCISFLKNRVPLDLQRQFQTDLKWFQEEYAKGDSSQYYAHASRENNDTIDAFARYLSRKKYASKINIQDISDFLKKLYVR